MGCDIHLYVEHRNGSGIWESADVWAKDEDEPARLSVPYDKRFYSGRSYDLFAILADVRNGRGFAGIKTGDGFNPISEPRGLPSDVTAAVESESDAWAGDGHSHSHFTVAELLAYDWTQTTGLSGLVDAVEFARWDRYDRGQGRSPNSWSGSIDGPGIVKISEDEMRALLAPILAATNYQTQDDAVRAAFPRHYVKCAWGQSYYQCAAKFLSHTMPRLWRLGTPENVRIVFWFDN